MCVRNLYLKMHPENLAIARKNKKKRERTHRRALERNAVLIDKSIQVKPV